MMRILAALALVICPTFVEAASRPNVVVILADDLGYGDLGCFNPASKIATPNLDRLAAEGLKCSDAHAPAAVCTPTRYALLTGRYSWRTRLQRGIVNAYGPPLIAPETLTIAGLFRQHGYRTSAIGKWHLGWDWPKGDDGQYDFSKPIANGPITRGFERYFGVDLPNFPPYVFIENDRTIGIPSQPAPLSPGGFNRPGLMLPGWKLVDILPECSRRAVREIEEAAQAQKPFFFYFPLTSPHYPVVPSPEFQGKSGIGDYGDFVIQTDGVVGQVLDALKRTGVAENTLVIFTSDNGPEVTGEVKPGVYDRLQQTGHASMGSLRGAKRDIWEGGHRVPFIARWPGKITPGSVSAEPICHVDLMATAAEILGAKLPADAGVDSVSLLPVFLGQKLDKPLREATIYLSGSGKFAIRQGPWVMLAAKSGNDNGKGEPDWFKKQRGYADHSQTGELYNLIEDPSQKNNLYDGKPELVREMTALLTKLVEEGRSTPGPRQKNDVPVKFLPTMR